MVDWFQFLPYIQQILQPGSEFYEEFYIFAEGYWAGASCSFRSFFFFTNSFPVYVQGFPWSYELSFGYSLKQLDLKYDFGPFGDAISPYGTDFQSLDPDFYLYVQPLQECTDENVSNAELIIIDYVPEEDEVVPESEIYELPLPQIFNQKSERLPASYANFLISNGLVLLPLYQQKEDKKALEIMQKAFPSCA